VEDVVILSGGRGTRLQERTKEIPKPLVEVGEWPILWHVVRIYAAQGFRRFYVATGYKGELIEEFVGGESWPAGVTVECVDTGLDTPTGGRIHKLRDRIGERPFCATYGDGVADIDLADLLGFHREHGATATMTVVRPTLQFGVTELNGDGLVVGFHEKPRSDHWINGGFFCFESDVFGYLNDDCVLEREPLEALAAGGQLRGYRHSGFWKCMDTYKDAVELNDLWAADRPPWRMWE
jgi:glucose-1-phosphate cytidylyltransferase